MAATQAPARGRVAQRQQQTNAVARIDPDAARQALDRAMQDRQAALMESAASMIDPGKMRAVVLSTFTRTPALWECDPISIARAVIESAQAGLEPTGALGGAYLVPFFNGKTGRKEAQLIIGYTGLVKLMRRSGEVQRVEARVVRQADDFDYAYGLDPYLVHKPSTDVAQDANNPMTYAYAVIVYRSGERYFDVMSAAEILGIKARSKAKDSGPWVTDEPEMWKKTVLRRASKLSPLTVEAQRVLDAEDDIDVAVRARPVAPARAVAPSRIAARVMGAPDAVGHDPAPAGDQPPPAAHGEGSAAMDPDPSPPDAPVAQPGSSGVEPGTGSEAPPEVIEGEVVEDGRCGSTSPYGAETRCGRTAGHTGNHRNSEKESWS